MNINTNDNIIKHREKFWCIKSGLDGAIRNNKYRISSMSVTRSTGNINYFCMRSDTSSSITVHSEQFNEFRNHFITEKEYNIIENRKSNINKLLENGE